jgi:hypothetical protein
VSSACCLPRMAPVETQTNLIFMSVASNLLFLFFAQDVAHAEGAYKGSPRSQRPGLCYGRFSGDLTWPDLGDR